MAKKAKSKGSKKKVPGTKRKANLAKLHPDHAQKILSLHPRIIDAVHDLLQAHGVDAKIHRISFVPRTSAEDDAAGSVDDCPCGGKPCCFIDNVWTCCPT